MALAATSIWEVQTGGSDPNGGAFNPGNTSMATDLTATSGTSNIPVVSSASYTFISRDVGHWLFIKSGTNWQPGWYRIASVSAGAATLAANAGSWVTYPGLGPSIVTGCASVSSPTGGTWTIDYSQAATGIAFTDLVAPTTTTFTSGANPIGKNMVGNIVSITSGTGWNVARWEVSSTSTTTGTAANFSTGSTIATALSTGGTGSLGGALASPGIAAGQAIIGNIIWVKAGTYVISSSSSNVAGGRITLPGSGFSNTQAVAMIGYTSVRGDFSTRPIIRAANTADGDGSTLTGTTLLTIGNVGVVIDNINFSARSSNTTLKGISGTNGNTFLRRSKISGFTNLGINTTATTVSDCELTDCFTNPAFGGAGMLLRCSIHHNAAGGVRPDSTALQVIDCLIYSNTGVGIGSSVWSYFVNGCSIYGNTSHGIDGIGAGEIDNCILYLNGGYGINPNANTTPLKLKVRNCAFGANTSGAYPSAVVSSEAEVTLFGDPFVAPGSGNFAPNNTPGAGAALRAAGIPGVFPGGLTTGYLDIGAAQPADSGGGVSRGRML